MTHATAGQQDAAIRFLADPGAYENPGGAVQRHETHASIVFLSGEWAYKLKRAVTYPYLDFGTLAKRRAACLRELRLNRRTAPALYWGVRPIRRRDDGRLFLDRAVPGTAAETAQPDPDVVDYVVVMRRFDQAELLSSLCASGQLTNSLLDALAGTVAAFHDSAEPVSRDSVATHRAEIADTLGDLRAAPDLFAADQVKAWEAAITRVLDGSETVLHQRAEAGEVRRCHGDLHLRNIVRIEGQPCLFDAIEFNDALAEIDVLYDLAFLVMDLDQRGERAAANRVLNRYLTHRDVIEGLAAWPLFLSLRASVRAKVAATTRALQSDPAERDRLDAEAKGYFAAMQAYLSGAAPVLVAVGGVSGTGKTTLARALAPDTGQPPGALLLRSDVERKRLFGVGETERLPESAYQGRINAQVYAAMYDRARRALAAGQSVVLEATFLRRADRADVRKLAEAAGVSHAGIWLTAPADRLKARVTARSGDASDATAEVVAAQLEKAPQGPTRWVEVDAAGPVTDVVNSARARLAEAGIAVGGATAPVPEKGA